MAYCGSLGHRHSQSRQWVRRSRAGPALGKNGSSLDTAAPRLGCGYALIRPWWPLLHGRSARIEWRHTCGHSSDSASVVHLSLGTVVATWRHPVFGSSLVLRLQIASSTCLPRIQHTWGARSARSTHPERWDHRLGDPNAPAITDGNALKVRRNEPQ